VLDMCSLREQPEMAEMLPQVNIPYPKSLEPVLPILDFFLDLGLFAYT
jgi:hypothetical protein